jgi:hypothetical protein
VKAQSPLLGFNNNVKHKGRVFHIQTEDSGIKHPHVITHLFADGGRILKTTKTSYAEHIGAPNLQETVRQLMQEQHKAMFIALRDGQYDYLFDEKAPRPAPSQPGAGAQPSVQMPAVRAPASSEPVASPKPVAPGPTSAGPTSGGPMKKSPSRPRLDVDPRALAAQLQRPPGPLEIAASHTPIDLDLSALERAADEAQTPFFQQLQPDLPPPPATVLGKKPDGRTITLTSYRSATKSSPEVAARGDGAEPGVPPPPPSSPGRPHAPSAPLLPQPGAAASPSGRPSAPARPASTGGQARLPTPIAPQPAPAARTTSAAPPPTRPLTPIAPQPPRPAAGGGRYAPPRPAAIFTPKKPAENASLFGDDLISEKSLDEVILSYLAEDLEGTDKK